jgi:hypothetical protein
VAAEERWVFLSALDLDTALDRAGFDVVSSDRGYGADRVTPQGDLPRPPQAMRRYRSRSTGRSSQTGSAASRTLPSDPKTR